VPVAAAFGVGIAVAATVPGQPEGEPEMLVSGQPGPQHAELVELVGEYTTASKLVLMEGADEIESAGMAKVSAIVDGRFIAIDERGTLLGNQFTSQKIWGYNREAGKYESTWLYSGMTAMTVLTGKSIADGKSVKLEGAYDSGEGRERYAVEFTRAGTTGFTIVQTVIELGGSTGARIETVYTRK